MYRDLELVSAKGDGIDEGLLDPKTLEMLTCDEEVASASETCSWNVFDCIVDLCPLNYGTDDHDDDRHHYHYSPKGSHSQTYVDYLLWMRNAMDGYFSAVAWPPA